MISFYSIPSLKPVYGKLKTPFYLFVNNFTMYRHLATTRCSPLKSNMDSTAPVCAIWLVSTHVWLQNHASNYCLSMFWTMLLSWYDSEGFHSLSYNIKLKEDVCLHWFCKWWNVGVLLFWLSSFSMCCECSVSWRGHMIILVSIWLYCKVIFRSIYFIIVYKMLTLIFRICVTNPTWLIHCIN